MKIYKALTVCSILLSSTLANAQMYKWIDANGQTHFSDKPHVSAKKIKVDGSGKVKVIPVSKNTKKSLTNSQKTTTKSIRIRLRTLLKQKEFVKLNKILSKLDQSFKKDIKNEGELFMAYESFFIKKESFESLFDNWVKATPDSYIPYAARAKYRYAMSWKARGNNYSFSTPEKQKYEMGQYLKKAANDLNTGLDLNDDSIVLYEILMRVVKSQGSNEDAKAVLKKALTLYPATYNLRNIYLASLTPRWGGSYQEMQNFINETAQFVKLNPKLKQLESAIYIDKGNVLALKKEYELASLMFNSGTKFGENSGAFYERGENYVRLEEYKKAINSLNKAIEISSDWPLYFYWRAKAYIGLNQYNKAADDLNYAYELDPYDNSIRDKKRWVASKLSREAYDVKSEGDTKSAIEKYSTAIKYDPDNGDLFNQRARAYYDERKHALALADIKTAIELEPENYNHYLMLDYLVVKSNRDWNLIIQYWNQYIELKPNDARAYAEVAGTYYHNRDIKSAKRNAKKAADMGNNNGIEIYAKLKNLN
ncbi:tetratricopeptide repeat protein [uncultured Cocleimonas sp.]|uniref:tetratricopeptide repeat protein n=1 Tax=uncultured Cocleimonas sp. TaxID=1051587 RepID=UPI00261A852A|nr:tetratricopeptide repeat protein [uncultured Cocleimonas sp.]